MCIAPLSPDISNHMIKIFNILLLPGFLAGGALCLNFASPSICIFKNFFGYPCSGCGLTRACGMLISCDFISAWKTNPIIFIIIPWFSYLFIKGIVSICSEKKVLSQ